LDIQNDAVSVGKMESVDADTVHEEVPFTPEETTPHHQQEALHGFTIPITLPGEVPVFMHIANSFPQVVICITQQSLFYASLSSLSTSCSSVG
jgi:hypothetical protein